MGARTTDIDAAPALKHSAHQRRTAVGGFAILGVAVWVLLSIACTRTAAGGPTDPLRAGSALAVDAPSDSLLVEAAGDSSVEASAGRPVSLVFNIRNVTGEAHVVHGRTVLPDGWRVLIPPSPIRLQPGGSHAAIISVSVPASAAAGDFSLHFAAHAHEDTTIAGRADVRVTVKKRTGIELVIDDAPEFVAAGEAASFRVRVANTGNSSCRIRVSIWMDGAELTASSTGVLEGGESVLIPLTADFPHKASGVVTVRSEAHDDPTISARRTLSVPIVARPRRQAGYHRVPAEVQVRLPGSGSAPHPQVVLSGSGTLFDEGGERVELYVRTPTQQDVGIFGRPDLYRASYRSDRFDAIIGDHIYDLSSLTTSGGTFFGAQTESRIGAAHVGALVNQSRRQFFDQGQQAVYARYGSLETGQAGIHVLNRTGFDAGRLATIRGLRHYHPLLHIDAEAGLGWMESERGAARRLRVEGASERLNYVVHHEHVGLDYPSSQRGRGVNSARLTWSPGQALQLYGQFHRSASEYPYADGTSSALRHTRIRLGTRYRRAVGDLRMRAGASAERVGRHSTTAETSSRGRSLAVRAEGSVGYRAVGIQTSAEFGTVADDWMGGRRPFQEYTVQTSFQPSYNQGYNLFLHYFRGARLYSPGDYRNLTLNASAYYRPGPRTTLRIRSGAGLSRFASWSHGVLVQGDIEHRLRNGHSVELSALGQKYLGSEIRQGLFLMSYTVPLLVPLTPSRVAGRLTGHVIDTNGNAGLADVRVLLGERIALTDRHGAFEFAGVDPGTYRLSISRADLGLDIVSAEPLPRDVTLRAGERRTMRLEVAPGASIAGRVDLFSPAENGRLPADTTLVSQGGLRNAVVDLVRDDVHIQQVTDRLGEFRFVGLSPGTWTISVASSSLPPEHMATPAIQAFELHPGEHEKVAIDVVPRPRRIRFMRQNEND